MTKNISELQSIRDYLKRLSDDFEFTTPRKAVLEETENGYFRDVASITFFRDKEPEIWARNGQVDTHKATPAELAAIQADLAGFDWPMAAPIRDLKDKDLPTFWHDAAEIDRHVINDEDGHPVLLQVRVDKKGEKDYLPITAWTGSRGGYRYESLWPDGPLPLFNLDLVKRKKASTVFVHEGPKSAARAQRIADGKEPGHPWQAELSGAVHIAFLRGAWQVKASDWDKLLALKIDQIYIVPDNDSAGQVAAKALCKLLRKGAVYSFEVGGTFPVGWDFGDDLPKELFNKNGLYIGRTFGEHILPVTYATSPYEDEKGKTQYGLSRDFAPQWYFVNDENLYVHRRFSSLIKTESEFNNYLAPFSDVSDVSQRLKKDRSCHVDATIYRPGHPKTVIFENNKRLFNVYEKSNVKPIDGDAGPFYEFMDYLLPDPIERKEVLRWFFTLAGNAKTRMHYSCLLYGQMGGTGKSTFADVLHALVGTRNTTVAHPRSLKSDFNSHFDGVRLLVMHEIYEGGSNFITTNALKTVLTDTHIRINRKHRDEKTIENFVHILACSNDENALDLNDKDRRWLVGSTTETPWEPEKFAALREWLFEGIGLNILMAEAEKFSDYVKPGARAPDTRSKGAVIANSKSEVELAIDELDSDFATQLVAIEKKVLQDYLTGGRTAAKSDSSRKNAARLKAKGWGLLAQLDDEFEGYRPEIDGKKRTVFVSPALKEKLKAAPKDEWVGLIKPSVTNPHQAALAF
jgi:hypothetical protein